MYDIISAFQCYTISVDVYFPFHCTLWMACFTFLLILCYCCCAHDNDVSHTLHREWGVTPATTPTPPTQAPPHPPRRPPTTGGGGRPSARPRASNGRHTLLFLILSHLYFYI